MQATVNLALRSVELLYTIKKQDLDESLGYDDFSYFELQYRGNKIICKHTLYFKDVDEWQSSLLFDGRMIDFHFDYEPLKNFNNKKEWLSYIMQGYLYIEGQEQRYEKQVINKVKIEL